LKIADFGFARQFQDGNMLESQCGTPMYMAPELIDGLNYTDKADLWSVGVILYQLLFDQLPFNGSSWAELKNNVRNDLRFPKVPTVSETCIDLLRKLLQRNPKNRISFNEFFKHPFLEEFEVIEKPIIAKAKVEDDPVDLNVAANPPPPPKSGKQRRRYVGNIAFLEVKDAHENIKRILNRSIMIARLGDSNMSWSESFHEDFSNSEIYAEERGQEMYSNYTILESFALYLEAILIFSDLFEMISTLRISMANSAPIQNIDSTELDNLNKSALIKYNDVIVKASKCKETIESESLERHEIDSIGTIIYKKSLKIGSDAIAVEAIDSDLAKKKYRVARELLLHIKEGFPVNSSDTKTLDQCNTFSFQNSHY
jgi:serine/threonine protein kinase